jgi:hypothetical protein
LPFAAKEKACDPDGRHQQCSHTVDHPRHRFSLTHGELASGSGIVFSGEKLPQRLIDYCLALRALSRLVIRMLLPELPYYAHRGCAGGQNVFMYGYFDSSENQRKVLEGLRPRHVPFVLIPICVTSINFPSARGRDCCRVERAHER